ncbi:MerR family transcriptional regulator [Robbsia andropogonis]|uniref:MerR family transcriptional regulator n=1 Tax=Robbsia andropogonis TaxID=28092 RepID=UPI00209C78F5|nr:MerR family transcriptional regulator [Robbsia andropogonis]MCP1117891.1 MerR family transcriptional regulator [Robbsia andropogonis]MCP1127355.1 MerR family transcriptional regulator [Robbsia andropogonis]
MAVIPLGLNASEAARRLGVSTKALRLYEEQHLVRPGRTAAGYRLYGPEHMARAGEIVALRALGLSLAQVAGVLDGDAQTLEKALESHAVALSDEIQDHVRKLDKVRSIRSCLIRGQMPARGELAHLLGEPEISVAFDLPWPWGGEHFELCNISPLNYIIGSLGSGKTRLAMRLAETLPDAAFLGLDRLDNSVASVAALLDASPALKARVDRTMTWLTGEGAKASHALTALLAKLETDAASFLIVDMIEQDLDENTQRAFITHLRYRAKSGRQTLFLLTRSTGILDLASVGPDETIILCPANHSPPMRVAADPGAPGYEAVATCLASPDVRIRVTRPPVSENAMPRL